MTKLGNGAAFFASVKAANLLGPSLDQSEVDGVNAILAACGAADWGPKWTAYALATADRETGGTMQPIKEWGGPSYFTRMYDVQGRDPARARKMGNTVPGDGPRYCGRGYVQLTWKANYAKAGAALGYPLTGNPDLAMRPDIAAAIMVRGMAEGWFTGRALKHYITAEKADFVNARRIINGTDHADEIAAEAERYLAALKAGEWA
jgi:putative chitinase